MTPVWTGAWVDTGDKQIDAFAKIGVICGLAAFLFLPPVLGPIGIVFGAMAWNKGHPRGQAATIISICGTVLGMIIGAAVVS